MAKRKEQKKKEREKRVAQKKIAARKRAQEEKAAEPATTSSKSKKVFGVETGPKKEFLPTTVAAKKPTHMHRRAGS